MNRDISKTTRRVELHPAYETPNKICSRVILTDFSKKYGTEMPVGERHAGQYCFVRVNDETADVFRGELPNDITTPVMYVGDHLGKHYYQSKPRDDIPVDVYEELLEQGYTLVEHVKGGWATWDGRPEWSETYVDVSDAAVVDVQAIIDERREEQ